MIPPRMRPSAAGASLRFVCALARDERALAQSLHAVMQWLPQVDGLTGSWSAVRPDNCKPMACSNAEDIEVALEIARAVANRTNHGTSPSCAYQSFFLGPLHRYHASIRLELWQGADTASASNQAELVVHPAIEPATARQILLALVGFIKPAWAAAGPDDRPPRSFDVAKPAVGWLTYLSSAYAPPHGLPPSADVSSMKSLGILIQASPERFDPREPAHLQSLAAIERAIGESAP